MARLASFMLSTFVVLVVPVCAAWAQGSVHIVVNFTEVETGGFSGGRRIARTVEASLLGGNRIEDIDRRRGMGMGRGRGRGRGGHHGNAQTSEGAFRNSFSPVQGGRAIGEWRVGANNTLVRTVTYGHDQETIVVSLSGAHACVARVTFRLKPGERMFVRRHGSLKFTDVHAENISCSISG